MNTRLKADDAGSALLEVAKEEAGVVGSDREQVWKGGVRSPRALSAPVRQAMQMAIAEHHRPLKLSDLAEPASQTPFQLIRAFRRELGITPHALLVRIRLRRAIARLVAGEPIASVAAAVGFTDQAHFTRRFKRAYGCTPARFVSMRVSRGDAGGDRCGAGAR